VGSGRTGKDDKERKDFMTRADHAPSANGRRSLNSGSKLKPSLLLPLAMILAFAPRCGNTPTGPSLESVRPTPGPLDLNGEWSGTFVGGRCTTAEQVRMRLSHSGNRVGGFFNMSCLSTHTRGVELDGEVGGGFPHAWLIVNDQNVCLLSGVSATSTRLTLWSRSSNLCVGAELHLTR
jgi:hypothetical protein